MKDENYTYGSPAPYVSQTPGSAPSAGPASRLGGSVRVQNEAWMRLPLHCSQLHRFERNGKTMLYDVHSGAFFEADETIRDIVDAAEGRTLLELFELFQDTHTEKDVYSAVKELRTEGILSETEIVASSPPNPPSQLEITRLELVVTTDECNSRSPDRQVAYLDEATGRGAIDTLIDASGNVRDLQIAFVGGEPLLNAPLVLRLIDYALDQSSNADKQVSTIVVTDGTCLNERMCGELELRGTVVRLVSDGSSRALDAVHGSGPASLSTADLRGRNLDVHLRIESAEEDDLSTVETVLDRYPDARSVSLDGASLASIDETALDQLGEIARTRWIRGQKVRFREIEDRMDQVAAGRVAAYHDADGLRSIAVDTSGDIYVSTALIGIPQFRLGHCDTGLDRARQREWIQSTHIRAFDTCRDCWARHLCAGGSRSQAYLANGDVRSPDAAFCRSQKRLYEIAISLYTDLAESHPEVAATRFAREQAA
jgi:uncharacterized protein